MPLRNLVGKDATDTPLITDFRIFGGRLLQKFHDQPLIIRKLAPYVTTVTFDGKNEIETPTWDDMEDAEYGMIPGESNADIEGDSVITKLPQIYKSAERLIDHWNLLFANKARLPIVLTRLRQKVKIKEDKIGFQGDPKTGTVGLVTGGEQLTPTVGSWKTDTGNNGILDIAQSDFEQLADHFSNYGLGQYPIDVAISFPAYNLLKNYKMPYRDSNNLKLALETLNGGQIFPSNYIASDIAQDTNYMLGFIRVPAEEAGWGLLSSEVEDEVMRTGMYKWAYGVREKFAVEIVDKKMIAVLQGIDCS